MAEQPEWAKTVAAYEVPLPTTADKTRFLELLSEEAEAQGFHVDSATADELRVQSEASPITFNATVWRGEDDEEPIASAMDFKDHIGRIWLSLSQGSDPDRTSHFRETLIPRIENLWPETTALPIMPNGAIPLAHDLVRTSTGYAVKPSAAGDYRSRPR